MTFINKNVDIDQIKIFIRYSYRDYYTKEYKKLISNIYVNFLKNCKIGIHELFFKNFKFNKLDLIDIINNISNIFSLPNLINNNNNIVLSNSNGLEINYEIKDTDKNEISNIFVKNKNENENENENENKNNNEYINAKVEYIINNILTNFKNNEPDKSLTFLKSQSSPSNMVKNTDNKKLEALFNDSKYGILFKKFKDYKIENYFKTIEEELDNTEYYTVDVRVKADYNTMIYNGIQFNDMYYPNENEDSNEKLCSIIYRWTFRKMPDNNYLLESCYLVSRTF